MATPNPEYFRFKSIMLLVFISSIGIGMFGSFFFPTTQFCIFAAILLQYQFKTFTSIVIMVINYLKNKAILNRRGTLDLQKLNSLSTHVFVIPSFKEDIQIVRGTIELLSKHAFASSYFVFLAMEKREKQAPMKAQQLQKQFKGKFKVLSYTLHEEQPLEAKSKNSNINWCVRHCVPTLIQNGINLDETYITIMDADSLVPELYVNQVNRHMQENISNRHRFVYQPPQIFTRNQKEANFIVRLVDLMMSYAQTSFFYSISNYTLGVSNYTISYRTLEKMDFFDTCIYSRTEDIRTPAKAYWTSNGNLETVPIITPFCQMSINTGLGWIEDIKARFVQAKRHALGQIQVSYNLVSFMNSKKTFRDFYVLYTVFELYFFFMVVPVCMLVFALQHALKILPHTQIDNGSFFQYFNILNLVFLFCSLPLYEIMKRKNNRQIYEKQNVSALQLFLLPIIATITAIFFGMIPMVMGSFKLWLGGEIVHQVAQKKATKKEKQTNFMSKITSMEFKDDEQIGILSQEISEGQKQ